MGAFIRRSPIPVTKSTVPAVAVAVAVVEIV
jgi:hypothetical protein